MIKKGKLVVLEGIDKAGKGKQLKLLEKNLLKLGIAHQMFDFPRHGQNPYSKMVDHYLKGDYGKTKDVSPDLVTLMYASDRLLAKPYIESGLRFGKLVITGRYVSSNKAYSYARMSRPLRKQSIREADDIEYRINQLPREDLVILLDIPVETAFERKGDGDLNEIDLNYQKQVAKVYQELLKQNSHWRVVKGYGGGVSKSAHQISSEILEILKNEGFLDIKQKKVIYFGCPIEGEAGGEEEKRMIMSILHKLGHQVDSETFLAKDPNFHYGKHFSADETYSQNRGWIEGADVLVMDVTRLSHGVGYEIGWAVKTGKPVLALCRQDKLQSRSTMFRGNTEPNFRLYPWKTQDDVRGILKTELGEAA